MPQIKFTDGEVAKLKVDATTWFTDPAVKGLRLCVTAGATKTWWVNKWDPVSQKVRSVKLGQWANRGTHCKWAKDQVGLVAHSITSGEVRSRAEKAVEAAKEAEVAKASALPTLGQALDEFIALRSNPARKNITGKRPMSETTIADYRSSFKKHLKQWGDVAVDQLPVHAISNHLNLLQLEKPQAAQRAAGVLSTVLNFVSKSSKLDLKVPGLADPTATRSRAGEDGDIDMSIPLADRWKDIQSVEREVIRLAMELTVWTGMRARPLLELTWERVYQVDVEGGKAWAVNLAMPVKHQADDREVVLGDDAGRIIDRLWAIRRDDCEWVFPSHRFDKDRKRVHLYSIDTVGQTTGNTARHYWMPIARTHLPLASAKWLALHSLKGAGFGMLGHYGKPGHQEQYEAANVIASVIKKQLGVLPANVIEIRQATA